jgi:hypothetical protein
MQEESDRMNAMREGCLQERSFGRGLQRAFVSVSLLGVCLLLVCGSASATVEHRLEGSFNGSEAPSGPFSTVASIAVDGSSGASRGDVYVGEGAYEGTYAVEKFHEDGSYTGLEITGAETPQGSLPAVSGISSTFFFGIAVDGSGSANRGDVYVADSEHGVVDRFSESGAYLGQLTGAETPQGAFTPAGVAVDSSGHLYASDFAHGVIDEFEPSGKYLREIENPEITSPTSLAVDSSGNLYVENLASSVVEFNAKGELVRVLDSSSRPVSVAVDHFTGHIDVGAFASPQHVAEYDEAGNQLDLFGSGVFPEGHYPLGLASGVTGKIYAAPFNFNSPNGLIDIFGPYTIVPTVSTSAATNVTQTTAEVNGHVDLDTEHGGGEVTECKFEYVTDKQFNEHPANRYEGAAVVSCAQKTPYSSAMDVSAPAPVTPSTRYHFRLTAKNSEGTGVGGEETLTTYGPPTVGGELPIAVAPGATLTATIDPFGYDTTCHAQYVDEADFQSAGYAHATTVQCVPGDVGAEFAEKTASVTLSGLPVDTTYHFRFIATNQAGTAFGADRTFATFGISAFSVAALDQEGEPFTQAGGHPYELTDNFTLNTTSRPPSLGANQGPEIETYANPKEIQVELPAGLIGNPDATPKCTPDEVAHADCTGAAQVGVLNIYTSRNPSGNEAPVYNVVPPTGIAAQFAARFSGFVTAHIDGKLRTGGDYGVSADSLDISTGEGVTGVSLTMWGIPGDSRHDSERRCPAPGQTTEAGPCLSGASLVPFLTTPTSCAGSLTTTMRMDSWQEPAGFVQAAAVMPGMTGCNRLDFSPKISVQPEASVADSPTGLSVDLHVPQNENPTGLAEANLKEAVVALPAGVMVNPAGATGRVGCSAAEIELHGPERAQCPEASKIGSVEILSPLVNHPVKGAIYLAQQGNSGAGQGSNPFGSLLATYIAVYDPETGVVVKLAGKVSLDEHTGQLTSTFGENPQLPFEDLKLVFFGGSRSPLATPTACGSYATVTALTPWSTPEGAPAIPSSTFSITSKPGGGCAPAGFAPSLAAGTLGNRAGAFSPFTMTLSRQDGEQRLSTVAVTMPPGVAGMLAGVRLCGEPQAAIGSCPAASQVGHVTVTAGVGGSPVTLPQAGRPQDPVYLTGPYEGAPFGLAIVIPAEAGPFNLDENGHPVVVRARIMVDPHTAQVSVISDPAPQMLQGVPTDVKTINVTIDRAGFTFNPTSCSEMHVTGTVGSAQGATAGVSERFQAAECGNLAFKPKFTASTGARTSKANGAGLTVKVSYPKGSLGVEANIAKVKVSLPRQLPSRGSTLEKACVAAVFEANPAACPSASAVGTGTVSTPVLKNSLRGPAYLVSHGGAGFPDMEIVLQGEGITLILDGQTQIKHGITSSLFRSSPDAPINSFTLSLPTGPHSILASFLPARAKWSMCRQKLTMPTLITAQNGATLKQTTKITVTGCTRAHGNKAHRPKHR